MFSFLMTHKYVTVHLITHWTVTYNTFYVAFHTWYIINTFLLGKIQKTGLSLPPPRKQPPPQSSVSGGSCASTMFWMDPPGLLKDTQPRGLRRSPALSWASISHQAQGRAMVIRLVLRALTAVCLRSLEKDHCPHPGSLVPRGALFLAACLLARTTRQDGGKAV